jgi:hypothetical protein
VSVKRINDYLHFTKMHVDDKAFEAEARVIIFKNSVRTSKRTPHFTITKINWLTLFKEIFAVYAYTGNHSKYTNTKCRVPYCKTAGIYSYHSAVKG